MWRQVCSTAGAIVAIAVLSTGCSGPPVIGVLLPASGPASTYGESIESGMRLAISEARELEQLPVGLEVVWVDTESAHAAAYQ